MLARSIVGVLLLLLAVPDRGRPCTYCTGNFGQRLTLRQNARLAKFVVLGTLSNPRLDGDKGATDFQIEQRIQADAVLGARKTLTIPSYVPGDARQRYLLFGDFVNGRLDIVHSRPVPGVAAADYLKAALAIDDRDRAAILQFSYKHLDAADAEVAEDAFHEFAKANDQEIAQVAPKLSPDKFRLLLKNPKVPADRIGIYAYMLGACGQKADADLLLALIRQGDERSSAALSGLIGGLIELQPDQGWALLQQILSDPKRTFADKLNAHGTLRFFHANKPKESRTEIVRCMAALVDQGDMADMAIEDLRRWHWWDLTPAILAQYGKPTHGAPIVRKAIVRYAMCSPDAAALAFIKARRQAEPNLVHQVEQSLEFEKPPPERKDP